MSLDNDESRKDGKTKAASPGPGWRWEDVGPRGPHWYPPILEGDVDTSSEHLVLCRVDASRNPGDVLALVGIHDEEHLHVCYLNQSQDTKDAVERLFNSCFDDLGSPACFELAYVFVGKTANREYSNPMWIYNDGS